MCNFHLISEMYNSGYTLLVVHIDGIHQTIPKWKVDILAGRLIASLIQTYNVKRLKSVDQATNGPIGKCIVYDTFLTFVGGDL